MNNCKTGSEHFENLLLYGYCHRCKKVYGLGTNEEVEKRAVDMREAFKKSGQKV